MASKQDLRTVRGLADEDDYEMDSVDLDAERAVKQALSAAGITWDLLQWRGLGFALERTAPGLRALENLREEEWFCKGCFRVVLAGKEGVQVYRFATANRDSLVWSMSFKAETPASVVLAALSAAVAS